MLVVFASTLTGTVCSVTTPTDRRSLRLLITAGPTHEPIDEVRYIGNRSSGRLGAALADEAAAQGWEVVLLLGPGACEPTHTSVRVVRFQTTADLESLLREHAPWCDALVMAAAVADYTPILGQKPGQTPSGKIKRGKGDIVLKLRSTPDLIREEASRRRDDQIFVAFALEPRERLLESARNKLERKGVDAIVANPLETMDSDSIEAVILTPEGAAGDTRGPISKSDFAPWLLGRIESLAGSRIGAS